MPAFVADTHDVTPFPCPVFACNPFGLASNHGAFIPALSGNPACSGCLSARGRGDDIAVQIRGQA